MGWTCDVRSTFTALQGANARPWRAAVIRMLRGADWRQHLDKSDS
jgi:hypothetical protein